MRLFLALFLFATAACDNTLPEDASMGKGSGGDTGSITEPDADADADGSAPDDLDGDGFDTTEDCDDTNENVHPDAIEQCSTPYDDNCSGDNNDLDAINCTDFFADGDDDGYAGNDSACHCEPTETHAFTEFTDCDDDDTTVSPEATEIPYDGLDNDCVDGDLMDVDSDGALGGTTGTDCNDTDATIFPGADEVCDDIDNDCDGAIDDDDSSLTGTLSTFYIDSDGDWLGSATDTYEGCVVPDGYVENSDDCDDGDASTGAATDWYADDDGDGYGDAYEVTLCMGYYGLTEIDGDCDDSDPTINPGAEDYCGDGIDHDCSGEDDDWGPECTDLEPQDVLSMVSCTGSETGTAFTVTGNHIKVRYGTHGMWWDSTTDAGLQIKPGGRIDGPVFFKDVTSPGTPVDYLVVDRGAAMSGIGTPYTSSSSDYSVTCAQAISIGDVIGATHSYTDSWIGDFPFPMANVTIHKTELWNKAGQSMLVDFRVEPSMHAGAIDVSIQRFTDFDIDGISDEAYDTIFERNSSTGTVLNTGPTSDVSIAMGSCSDGRVGSHTTSPWTSGWSYDALTEDLCNPDDWTGDWFTIYDGWLDTASWGVTPHQGFVLSIGTSPSSAEGHWDDTAEDYCGDAWSTSTWPSFPDGMCNGTIIWDPSEPIDFSL